MSGHQTAQVTTIFVSAVESSRDAGRPIDSSHHKAEYAKPYPTPLGDSKPTADGTEHPVRTVRNMAGLPVEGRDAEHITVASSNAGRLRRWLMREPFQRRHRRCEKVFAAGRDNPRRVRRDRRGDIGVGGII